MHELFRASNRSHTTYRVGSERRRKSDGKIVPEYLTVKKPVTAQLWRLHLEGKRPLGVGLACDDGTSRSSGVDIDDYGIDVVGLAKMAKALGLPIFFRYSKSGGAHGFCFHDVPIPTAEAEAFARAMADALGIANKPVEYFPPVQSADSLPISINMPFFGGDGGFIKVTGAQMAVTEFLRIAERSLVTEEQRAAVIRPQPTVRRRARAENNKPSAASPANIGADLSDKMAADRGKGNSTNPADLPKPRKFKDDIPLECEWALTEISPDIERKIWLRIGAGLYNGLGDHAGFKMWNDWSSRGKKYEPEKMQNDWIQARDKYRSQNVTAVFKIADKYNTRWRDRYMKALAAMRRRKSR